MAIGGSIAIAQNFASITGGSIVSDIVAELRARKLVAIVRGISGADIIELAQALVKGGISCIEVTYNQSGNPDDTLESISLLSSKMGGEMLVGAGTVMSVEQVGKARDAGAGYIISPNVDTAVIAETKRLGLCSMPGALTPTEIATARAAGADMVKLCPVAQLGPAYIKAVRAPLSHIPLIAVGGVSPKNIGEFFKAGVVGAGVGGNLVSKELVREKRFAEITALAREYIDALKSV